ncbi:MAG: hypothetical protein KTR25_00445 [Myxococcales bacterium]|nr:hypothetical protein [Myxococcales bacterium]
MIQGDEQAPKALLSPASSILARTAYRPNRVLALKNEAAGGAYPHQSGIKNKTTYGAMVQKPMPYSPLIWPGPHAPGAFVVEHSDRFRPPSIEYAKGAPSSSEYSTIRLPLPRTITAKPNQRAA